MRRVDCSLVVVLVEAGWYSGAGSEVNILRNVGKVHDIVHERQDAPIDFEQVFIYLPQLNVGVWRLPCNRSS